MAKRKPPPIGKCVHCLTDNVTRNWDHVFPKSWYPDTTPPNISKWIIPSCPKCNMEYGELEQDLLMRLACCVDPKIAAASGIYQKVLRSMDARYAPNQEEARIRIARRNKLLAEMLHGNQIPEGGIYPGFGERWGRPKDAQVAMSIPASSFRRLTEKIVRGIFFIEDNKYIEPSHSINFYALEDDGASEITEMLSRFGKEYARGPGILINRAVMAEDGVSAIISIEVWGSFKMYASVMPPLTNEFQPER